MGLPVPEYSHQLWHCPCPRDASWYPPTCTPFPEGARWRDRALSWDGARPAGLITSR